MASELRQIVPSRIKRNHDNPRIFFRSEEMDTLTASIKRYGIQVPITVYQDGRDFILIDGERRWRCALKLNLPTMPALVQEKPSPLKNLLLMFNIHALREQWDYFTIARKLPDVVSLFQKENKSREPTEIELSELTGLTRGQIRRCRFLLDLPPKYHDILVKELSLPKNLQTLSEDFFIEMERALKTVNTRLPSAIRNMDTARDVLIQKFRAKTIKNITDFRMLSKMATSIGRVGVQEEKALEAIRQILNPQRKVGIQEIFAEQFEMRFDERKVLLSIDSIYEYLEVSLDPEDDHEISEDLRSRLTKLRRIITRVLGS